MPSPDPLRLRRLLGVQGLGFALLLLTAFAAAVYWGIAGERQESLRAETRQLAATAASQLPLISHEFSEDGNTRKFRNDREVVELPQGRVQRVQWFDPRGRLLVEEGALRLPPAGLGRQARWQRWAVLQQTMEHPDRGRRRASSRSLLELQHGDGGSSSGRRGSVRSRSARVASTPSTASMIGWCVPGTSSAMAGAPNAIR